jgi:hypothetical protein
MKEEGTSFQIFKNRNSPTAPKPVCNDPFSKVVAIQNIKNYSINFGLADFRLVIIERWLLFGGGR